MSRIKQEVNLLAFFIQKMAVKLRMNSHKPDWQDDSYVKLFNLLIGETEELKFEIFDNALDSEIARLNNVIDECADVANFAAMISDKARKELEGIKNESL